MISVENLSKSFGQKLAVDDISFEVKKGEVLGFLGPNGAGKSTTMRMVTGYLPSTSGEVAIDGINVADDPISAKQKIGYLPENNPLYEEMYVKEYLWFCKQFYKGNGFTMEDLINKTGLEKCKKQKIKELSKGYRQRVGIAASIFHNPAILFLDEPTTGLDPNQTLEIRNLIKSLAKDKIVLISSHILQEIEAMCNKVIILNNGEIILDDSLSKIQKKKIKLEKLFNRLTK